MNAGFTTISAIFVMLSILIVLQIIIERIFT